jgi:hypothetical protein
MMVQIEAWAKANPFMATLISAALISAFGVVAKGIQKLFVIHILENSARNGIPDRGAGTDYDYRKRTGLYGRRKEVRELKKFCRKHPDYNCYGPIDFFEDFLVDIIMTRKGLFCSGLFPGKAVLENPSYVMSSYLK